VKEKKVKINNKKGRYIMEEILVFGHKSPDTDTICSSIVMADLQNKLGKNVKAVRLGEPNKETKFALNYFGFEAPELIDEVKEGQEVILVDHNEFAQSVNGIENAKIRMVVDHHRICDFLTAEPLYYRAEPVGCTNTILLKLYKENGVEVDKKIAGLMLSAIISDTLLLKSPTKTEEDEKAVKELAEIAGVDYNTYGLEMLKAGTDLSDYSAEELISLDCKKCELKDKKAKIAQVNTADIPEMMKRKAEIESAMTKDIEENDIDLFVFAITDIIESNSQAIVLGKETVVFEKGFNVKLEDNTAFLPGVVSRKKQILPVLQENA
jgi:manganese-dependent inorganic pyrophosphatase